MSDTKLHPEIMYAERCSATDAEKVGRPSSSRSLRMIDEMG